LKPNFEVAHQFVLFTFKTDETDFFSKLPVDKEAFFNWATVSDTTDSFIDLASETASSFLD